jgi:DNA-binding FadR family transcriptional regulator
LTIAMTESARERHIERFFEADLRFHEALWRMSGNSFLPRLLAQTLAPLLAFLFIRNLRRHREIEMTASAEAHVEIARAIRSRDKEAARRVIQQKLQVFADEHLDWYDNEG